MRHAVQCVGEDASLDRAQAVVRDVQGAQLRAGCMAWHWGEWGEERKSPSRARLALCGRRVAANRSSGALGLTCRVSPRQRNARSPAGLCPCQCL
jgi:hypothetical protein